VVVRVGCTLREACKLSIFENSVLSKIVGTKRDEVAGGWRKLCNEEHHDLCILLDTIIMIESVRMRWVVHRWQKRQACRILVRKLEGDHLEELCVDGKILQWILKKQGQMVLTQTISLRTGRSFKRGHPTVFQ
jgi:hypothetical protein